MLEILLVFLNKIIIFFLYIHLVTIFKGNIFFINKNSYQFIIAVNMSIYMTGRKYQLLRKTMEWDIRDEMVAIGSDISRHALYLYFREWLASRVIIIARIVAGANSWECQVTMLHWWTLQWYTDGCNKLFKAPKLNWTFDNILVIY